ncbi:MAG: transposase [Thermoleophilia bacterium]|nr:transposase [Thermoleophilia bacterium]
MTPSFLLDKAIAGCGEDAVPEVRALGSTLARWRIEILGRDRTGASNGPTEGLSLLVKKVKRAGHGFRSFANCRRRILLHAGGVRRPPTRPLPTFIRTRSPRRNRKGRKSPEPARGMRGHADRGLRGGKPRS